MTWNLRSLRVRAAASGRGRLPAGHRQPQELIITGISRSGTSYLCSLLHRFDDCVAVNEPLEAIRLLRLEAKPVGLRTFYRDLRRDILAGRPIVNKLRDGDVVEDTAVSQRRRRYRPRVASADFVLAIKNTREFLSRLDAIREVMPSARVAACVRNPFDTIASWKGSFPHLRDADVQQFLGGSGAWLSERHRANLEAISRIAEPSWRRARLWLFFAERVLENRDELVLVDYDDLVARPMEVLNEVLDGFDPGNPRRPISASAPQARRELLDADDHRAIREICCGVATELGLCTDGSPVKR